MTVPIDIIQLLVGGKLYAGWENLTINDGIQQAAAGFELSVTERWQTVAERRLVTERWKLRAGDACEVLLGDEVLLTGFIDVHQPSIASNSHTVRLSGRSRVGDLVDCSAVHEPGNFVNQTILQIAESLAKPFNIPVVLGAGVALQSVPKFELNQGESVFDAIERLARQQQLLLTSDAVGRLVLDQAGMEAYPFELAFWTEASLTCDMSRRFSAYIGKGQQHGADFENPLEAAQVSAEVQDMTVQRYRPLIVRPEGTSSPHDTAQRVAWQANRDMGDSLKFSCTLVGYRDPAGKLWRKNRRIRVRDTVLGVDNELLIESVKFSKGEQGSSTHLELVHPGAYAPEPATTGEKGKRMKVKAATDTGQSAQNPTTKEPAYYFDL